MLPIRKKTGVPVPEVLSSSLRLAYLPNLVLPIAWGNLAPLPVRSGKNSACMERHVRQRSGIHNLQGRRRKANGIPTFCLTRGTLGQGLTGW